MKNETENENKLKRTLQQNAALHLWFTQLAEALNDAGFDMRKTIREGIDIPWTPYTIKEYLWRPVQKELLQKISTTQLDKLKDIDSVYDVVNRVVAERTGIHIPFPSIDTAIDALNEKNGITKRKIEEIQEAGEDLRGVEIT